MKRSLLLLMLATTLSYSQQWKWPDKPKNVKVLSPEITADRLHETMDGYKDALGVRCNFCHVGEDGKPFSEFDFVSDQLPMKNITREMIRMTNSVNAQIRDLFKGGSETPVEVTCVTCHRGSPVPERIEDLLWKKYELKGITEAATLYREMRRIYHGSFTYDFREHVLLGVAQRCEQEKKQVDDAIVLMELNAEFFPESPRTLNHLASLYIEKKEPEKAKPLIVKVLSMDPNNRFAKRLQTQIGK
ncbi:MAG: c-type cytochrome [Ignavibacteriales bacterium]|nr:c-type cytochrome [Ignavibacteriales bacterium]